MCYEAIILVPSSYKNQGDADNAAMIAFSRVRTVEDGVLRLVMKYALSPKVLMCTPKVGSSLLLIMGWRILDRTVCAACELYPVRLRQMSKRGN